MSVRRALRQLLLIPAALFLSGCIAAPEPRDIRLSRDIIALPPLEAAGRANQHLLQNRYDFDAWLLAQASLPEHAVILSLSGGATRAAAMSQSVLQALGQFKLQGSNTEVARSLADSVIAISATSGGAMTASAFVIGRAECADGDTAACDRQSIGLGLQSPLGGTVLKQNLLEFFLLRGIANPLAWPDRARPWVDFFAETFPRNSAGRPYSYADLQAAPVAPFLILNATDVINDRTFSFAQEQMNDLCADLSPMPLAVGIAASGNFPYLSTDIELRNFRLDGPCNWGDAAVNSRETRELLRLMNDPYGEPHRTVDAWPDGNRPGLDSATWARYRLGMRLAVPTGKSSPPDQVTAAERPDPARRIEWVHLYDGGLADNLGLWPIIRLLTRERFAFMKKHGVKDLTLIVVNARWDWTPARNRKSGSPYWTQLALDTGFDPVNRTTELTETLAISRLRQQFDEACGKVGGPRAASSTPCIDAIYPVVLDLDQLTGSAELVTLREEVKNFGDDQSLADKAPDHPRANGNCQDKICVTARAGRTLLARNPCFKLLVTERGFTYSPDASDDLPGPTVRPDLSAYPRTAACSLIDGRK